MKPADINGAWLSEGGLIYVVTQINHRFVWRVVHGNGRIETGIGSFSGSDDEETATDVEVSWNFDHGTKQEEIRSDNGRVILKNGKAIKIEWCDTDHFKRLPCDTSSMIGKAGG
jgi:hypothetical protein